MNSRERVLGAYNRMCYDRIPLKHEGTPEINQLIMDYFGLTNMEQVLRVVGDDFRYVEPLYIGPVFKNFLIAAWKVTGVSVINMQSSKEGNI
jgi:hypothetical protein